MKYARLGSSGMQVSRIWLGMMSFGSKVERAWHLDEAEAEPIVRRAAEAGVAFFDTADTYSDGLTEQITGRRHAVNYLDHHRDEFFIPSWSSQDPVVLPGHPSQPANHGW